MKSFVLVFVLFGCSTNPPASPDAATTSSACVRVGVELCAKIYACWSAQEIASSGLPPDEPSCVTMENASCPSAKPGYCKGHTETGEAAANTCADELHADTCPQFNGTVTSSDPCKTMCSP